MIRKPTCKILISSISRSNQAKEETSVAIVAVFQINNFLIINTQTVMGNCQNLPVGKPYNLSCATLNFSGININPFQYHDGSEEMRKISKIMSSIISKEGSNFSSNQLSIIDKKYKTSNVSVRSGHGMVKEDGKLPTKKQYLEMWKTQYRQTKPTSIKGDTEKVVEDMAMFEYYCYITLVAYVYDQQFDLASYEIPFVQDLDSSKLIGFLEQYLKKPQASLDKKADIVTKFIKERDVDLMFVQEGGSVNWKQMLGHSHEIKQREGSIIIFKKGVFSEPVRDLQEKYENQFFFNQDSVAYFTKRNHDIYLLMSIHLTSQKKKIGQAIKMLQNLKKFRDKYPEIKTIIGIDANQSLLTDPNNSFYTFPPSKAMTTTTKRRTSMQVQFHKAEVDVFEVKDHLMSTMPIKVGSELQEDLLPMKGSVTMINGEEKVEGVYLPNDKHPYDHFIVAGFI